jgi:pyruvate dehydrogenase E1 component alpha subunit
MTTSFEAPGIDLDAPIDIVPVGTERALELYARMALIREFESRVNALFLQGRIPGTIHLSHGQEACAVGGTASLRPTDPITITHRGHGQALAKGSSARGLMAELYARETGCCRGMGGSLHVGDWDVGALPGISIVGASIPISAGLAFAARHLGEDKVAVCFTGDGATTEGDAHEGYNLAALWKAPVVYVCENNLYSISTRVDRQAPVTSVAERVKAYALPAEVVDGNHVVAVTLAVDRAVAHARDGGGPSLVECLTYRQGGHKRDDPPQRIPHCRLQPHRRPDARVRRAVRGRGGRPR